ncbi:MAG: hypothetical protein FJY37_06665 [Betaproteobacteria bacterium]|nr:hypothetical protein [Betaproteobacteria bacterium]
MNRRNLLALCAPLIVMMGCASKDPMVARRDVEDLHTRTSGPALIGQEYGPKVSRIPIDAVLYTDRDLTHRVALQALSGTRNNASTVSVDARFFNCTSQAVQLGVRTSFMDKSQRPTEPASAWQTVYVPAHATAQYSEVSVGREEVAHYLVEIRNASL